MNWLFRSIFNTHKVLRGDLEQLPIWHEYFERYENFSEESLREYLGIIENIELENLKNVKYYTVEK